MKHVLQLPIKKGDKIFTIEDCKIKAYYVEGFEFKQYPLPNEDISNFLDVQLERYNDNVNSFTTKKRLSQCFLSEEELLEQL